MPNPNEIELIEDRCYSILNCVDELLNSKILKERDSFRHELILDFGYKIDGDGWCEFKERRCNPVSCERFFYKNYCDQGFESFRR